LTLNVLLSFAQFEREVTSERIRDKIAASKKKGMWMGGAVPLGYDAVDRKLKINVEEAKTVRRLFELYLELGSVRKLQEETHRLGLKTKIRNLADGRRSGGAAFSRGHLYRILSSPIYIGRIPHRQTSYDGEHQAIIDAETWDRGPGTACRQRRSQARSNELQAPEPARRPPVHSRRRPLHTIPCYQPRPAVPVLCRAAVSDVSGLKGPQS